MTIEFTFEAIRDPTLAIGWIVRFHNRFSQAGTNVTDPDVKRAKLLAPLMFEQPGKLAPVLAACCRLIIVPVAHLLRSVFATAPDCQF